MKLGQETHGEASLPLPNSVNRCIWDTACSLIDCPHELRPKTLYCWGYLVKKTDLFLCSGFLKQDAILGKKETTREEEQTALCKFNPVARVIMQRLTQIKANLHP